MLQPNGTGQIGGQHTVILLTEFPNSIGKADRSGARGHNCASGISQRVPSSETGKKGLEEFGPNEFTKGECPSSGIYRAARKERAIAGTYLSGGDRASSGPNRVHPDDCPDLAGGTAARHGDDSLEHRKRCHARPVGRDSSGARDPLPTD